MREYAKEKDYGIIIKAFADGYSGAVLNRVRESILDNPRRWAEDEENPPIGGETTLPFPCQLP